MADLFDQNLKRDLPLAERLRPAGFSEFIGQEEVIGPGTVLRQAIESDNVPSMIFWGPPGCGKTTLARLIANLTKARFIQFSATSGSLAEVRAIVAEARERKKFQQQRTILFVDEIHRFNKAQQDAFLPVVEDGTIILIGATTENPSFEVISPLLSRSKVFVLKALKTAEIAKILRQALLSDKGFKGQTIRIADELIDYLAGFSNGDARTALNALELSVKATKPGKNGIIEVNLEAVRQSLSRTHLLYDRTGEEHYNIISALHKSLRGSDADAGLYWLGRMLEAGEDPLYIARRLVRFASEDIGMSDPPALVQAVACYQACHFLGVPECNVHLAQAVVYLARAPKSNQLYTAYQKVQKDIKELPTYPVPLHLRNAPTALMKGLGYGKDYKYPPAEAKRRAGNPDYQGPVEQDYLPEELRGRKYLE
ncbi:MAG: AAA family ATPase [Candidatus Komeilibacteria bacterium RIFCSPLOWO2_01_FULL_45_10]|uniref:Replication-associated recombination protein A n=1 Tax=Candidatus Komeilibacteria bacterium RIFCSPLOWO2_01_FULL_45_10 TaxID=1798550 RepID=A0A1G2BLL5_9BACT|nr:MAG: AAA family ATPase [Candidatus Komeilibacteria bacterium RIFCSPLOWO2_01_FULL_45_10]